MIETLKYFFFFIVQADMRTRRLSLTRFALRDFRRGDSKLYGIDGRSGTQIIHAGLQTVTPRVKVCVRETFVTGHGKIKTEALRLVYEGLSSCTEVHQ